MASNIYGNGTTTATAGPNTIVHYYDKAGVKAANAIAVYAQFADRRSMPLNMGKTYKVSKWLHIYDRLSTDTDFAAKGYLTARNIADVTSGFPTLAEGSGPANQVEVKKVTIETSFARYGEMIDYTDEVKMFSEDMVQVHYREELGYLANRRSEDLVQRDMLATTNVMLVGTAGDIKEVGVDTTSSTGTDDSDSTVNYDLIRKAVKLLVRNRAEKNTSIVTGSTKIDTRTVNKAFYGIVGPEIKYDLENLTRGSTYEKEYVYIPAYKYADASNLAEGEVGAMNDVRFIESESAMVYAGRGHAADIDAPNDNYSGTLATTTYANAAAAETARGAGNVWDRANDAWATAAAATTPALKYFDVFPILFPTKGSFATVGLKGHGKIKFRAQSPEKVELSNPYGTKGFFSYNMWYAGIILREERLLKVLVCATS